MTPTEAAEEYRKRAAFSASEARTFKRLYEGELAGTEARREEFLAVLGLPPGDESDQALRSRSDTDPAAVEV